MKIAAVVMKEFHQTLKHLPLISSIVSVLLRAFIWLYMPIYLLILNKRTFFRFKYADIERRVT